jgi:hypothetical protein
MMGIQIMAMAEDELDPMLATEELGLWGRQTGGKEHVNNDRQDGWWRMGKVPLSAPLDDDENAHVSENGPEEDNLGNELEADVNPAKRSLLGVVVHAADHNTERHLQNTEQDRELHFERVVVVQFIG